MSVCVVSAIVKRPVLPPCVVDGRSRNPLYYYYNVVADGGGGCVLHEQGSSGHVHQDPGLRYVRPSPCTSSSLLTLR